MMKNAALLCIDVQKAFDQPVWGNRNNPDAELNIALLLDTWRNKNLPVIHIKHCSLEPNSPLRAGLPGHDFKDEAYPLSDEVVFEKNVNSAFIGTGLEAYLYDNDISSLVIVGLTTDHCVSTSTRMAGNLGFETVLVSDATATFDRTSMDGKHYSAEVIHNIHLVSLSGEFCTVCSTQSLLDEHLR